MEFTSMLLKGWLKDESMTDNQIKKLVDNCSSLRDVDSDHILTVLLFLAEVFQRAMFCANLSTATLSTTKTPPPVPGPEGRLEVAFTAKAQEAIDAAAAEAKRLEDEKAAAKAQELVRHLIASLPPSGTVHHDPWLLNVNMPCVPADQMKGFKVARLGRRHAAEPVITQTSPRGETMYWIGGAGAAKDDAEGTDFHATAQGYATITPLHVDLTDHQRLPYWAQTAAALSRKA